MKKTFSPPVNPEWCTLWSRRSRHGPPLATTTTSATIVTCRATAAECGRPGTVTSQYATLAVIAHAACVLASARDRFQCVSDVLVWCTHGPLPVMDQRQRDSGPTVTTREQSSRSKAPLSNATNASAKCTLEGRGQAGHGKRRRLDGAVNAEGHKTDDGRRPGCRLLVRVQCHLDTRPAPHHIFGRARATRTSGLGWP